MRVLSFTTMEEVCDLCFQVMFKDIKLIWHRPFFQFIKLFTFSIMLFQMVFENLDLMSFESEWPHQYDSYQGDLFYQTSLFFKQVNQCVVSSRIQSRLVIHQNVEINHHIVFISVQRVSYWPLKLVVVAVVICDDLFFLKIIDKTCSVVVNLDLTFFKPYFIVQSQAVISFCWVKQILLHSFDMRSIMCNNIRLLFVYQNSQNVFFEKLILLLTRSTFFVY